MSWDKRWMDLACLISTWSKDRSRQVAAVVVDDRNVLLSVGWNGFPRGVNDDIENRHKRPDKYKWTEHAERNAIYNAASKGISLLGSKIYLPWYPCSDCARAIIQSGITSVVCVEPDWNDPIFEKDFNITEIMFQECSIDVVFNHGLLPPKQKQV